MTRGVSWVHLLLCTPKQSSKLAPCLQSSCVGQKALFSGRLTPLLGSHPTALCSCKAQRPISDATSFPLPPAYRDTFPAHSLLSARHSPAPQVPHRKGGEGSATCPFICSYLLLPLWDCHFQPLHLHQQDLSHPWGSSSLTHCYPLSAGPGRRQASPRRKQALQAALGCPLHSQPPQIQVLAPPHRRLLDFSPWMVC